MSLPSPRWLVSRPFDAFFLANLYWPLLLWPGLLPAGRDELATEFWVIYFLTTPHRWITIIIVALDPDRRQGQPGWLFVFLAVLAGALVLGTWLAADAFVCLALADYLWNSWHFASQHQGILRLYGRKAGDGANVWERRGLRCFLFYTLLRTAGWTTGWLDSDPTNRVWLERLDAAMMLIPAFLLSAELLRWTTARIGKMVYLLSILTLYSGLLLSLTGGRRSEVIALAAAASMVHAVEYLAVVAIYSRGRIRDGREGLFRKVAEGGLGLLILYAIVLGLIGIWLSRPESLFSKAWIGLNLWAAFLHYAYDGMIWKLRRPATAKAFGVTA